MNARILLVEDEPKLRQSIAEGLRLEEWEVSAAGSGREAFRLLASQPFDLLLLDGMLPDHDGLEILRWVRARGSQMPVLFVTARASHHDQVTAFQNGVTAYVIKPFAFEELLTRCRALIAPAGRLP